MCAASFQVIFEGVRSIIEDVSYFRNVSGYAYEKPPVDINPAAISIMCITIGKTKKIYFNKSLHLSCKNRLICVMLSNFNTNNVSTCS